MQCSSVESDSPSHTAYCVQLNTYSLPQLHAQIRKGAMDVILDIDS